MDTKNREIKFRVWDKLNEKMNTNITRLALPHTEHEERLYGTVLMQYTNRKDYHDKEIYEGDILRRVKHYSDAGIERPKDGEYVSDVNGHKVVVEMPDFYDYEEENGVYLSYRYEIIGNIYENPELIKN